MSDLPIYIDTQWYLVQYPDVAAAGLEPKAHFTQHGYAEGRLPCALHSETAEYYLWRGVERPMLSRLMRWQNSEHALERAYACWALARWHAQQAAWEPCWQAIARFHQQPTPLPGHAGPWLLQVEAAAATGRLSQAFAALTALREQFPGCPDTPLAYSNLLAACNASPQARIKALASLYRPYGLATLRATTPHWQFDNLTAAPLPAASTGNGACPTVSVMVPMFNAADTITTALNSLLAQTWPSIELLLVDDASEDTTLNTVQQQLKATPPRAGIRVRLLRHRDNQGAYAARNTALSEASGELITTHDSDDWSHPQKLELQARRLLQKPALMGCFSHWVRADEALHFTHWCMETGWIYRNVSSLMLRRNAVNTLGYWDDVKAAADTEYHCRLMAVFGEQAVEDVLPGVPLAIGRQATGSLTQSSATHLTTMFQGVRQQYGDAYRRWHATFTQPRDAFLPRTPTLRPFAAPPAMQRYPTATIHLPAEDAVQQSPWWDAGWYLRHYPDLWATKVAPLTHFLTHGASENRDPGPRFSTSAYRACYGNAMQRSGEHNPLLHFLAHEAEALGSEHASGIPLDPGNAERPVPLPCLHGEQPAKAARPTVLLCGHQAPSTPFGAERCLIDTARALDALGFNVVLVLPELGHLDYWLAFKPYVQALHIIPYVWWHQQRPVCTTAVNQLKTLVETHNITAVHVNTVVQDAPCIAAQATGVPLIVHAHELPGENTSLCDALGASPEDVRQRVLGLANSVIANSQAVATFFSGKDKTCHVPIHVVPNTLDMTALLALPPCRAVANITAPLRVGMLSSHQPEKGLDDAARLAEIVAASPADERPIELHLYGPATPALEALKARQAKGELAHLIVHNYVREPERALAELDVMVNLSSVQESFGRTVLEAMTAQRVVVCYRLGALPELISHNETGLMAEPGDVQMIARHVRYLAHNTSALTRLARAAQQRALCDFKPRRHVEALARVYRSLFATP